MINNFKPFRFFKSSDFELLYPDALPISKDIKPLIYEGETCNIVIARLEDGICVELKAYNPETYEDDFGCWKYFNNFDSAFNFAKDLIYIADRSYDEVLDAIKSGEIVGIDGTYGIDKLNEDTVKKSNGKWTNRGDDGKEHGEFKTKKAADAQRKAMFANGYKGESLVEDFSSNPTLPSDLEEFLVDLYNREGYGPNDKYVCGFTMSDIFNHQFTEDEVSKLQDLKREWKKWRDPKALRKIRSILKTYNESIKEGSYDFDNYNINFDDEDLEFIIKLIDTDAIEIYPTEYRGIEFKVRKTPYIDSGIINFSRKFYDEIRDYIEDKYPEYKLMVNNTGSIIWLSKKYNNDRYNESLKEDSYKDIDIKTWNDAYAFFGDIVNKYFDGTPESIETVNDKVTELYLQHTGEEPFETAWKKWNDPYDEDLNESLLNESNVEDLEIRNPHFNWLDNDTFVMTFDGGVNEDGDEFVYDAEYWKDKDSYHFIKVFDDDCVIANFSDDKKNEIIKMMQSKMAELDESLIKEDRESDHQAILQRVFSNYPDINEDDEDYLNGLSYEELVNELKNRGWDDLIY